MILYAYVMKWDTGFAPCVKGNVLSLATCKTFLRYKIGNEFKASEDIYIMGLCGKELQKRHRKEFDSTFNYSPIYVAKITSVEKTKKYYAQKGRPDQKYSYDNKSKEWFVLKNNPHHLEMEAEGVFENKLAVCEKDLYYLPRGNKDNTEKSENYVLISKQFAYFGKDLTKLNDLPKVIQNICKERAEKCRCDRTPINIEDEKEFLKWFNGQISNNTNKENNKGKTIDTYFDEGGCKGECKIR